MAGYNPQDSEEKRVWKAHKFMESMERKGQPHDEALRIASRYYHVKEEDVNQEPCDEDDDIYFFCGSAVPVAASEIFNEGDFF